MKKIIFLPLLLYCFSLCTRPLPIEPGNDEIPGNNETPKNEEMTGNMMVDFPDPIFLRYVLDNFDRNNDGVISKEEAYLVTEIEIPSRDVKTLKGVEFFTNLLHLNCSDNELKNLVISKNVALKELNCAGNNLTNLDLSQNVALERLLCEYNELTSLDVSKNVALKELNCADNELTSLDLSKNVALERLLCEYNELTSLDISKTNLGDRTPDDSYKPFFDCHENKNFQTLYIKKGRSISVLYNGCLHPIMPVQTKIVFVDDAGPLPDSPESNDAGVNFISNLPSPLCSVVEDSDYHLHYFDVFYDYDEDDKLSVIRWGDVAFRADNSFMFESDWGTFQPYFDPDSGYMTACSFLSEETLGLGSIGYNENGQIIIFTFSSYDTEYLYDTYYTIEMKYDSFDRLLSIENNRLRCYYSDHYYYSGYSGVNEVITSKIEYNYQHGEVNKFYQYTPTILSHFTMIDDFADFNFLGYVGLLGKASSSIPSGATIKYEQTNTNNEERHSWREETYHCTFNPDGTLRSADGWNYGYLTKSSHTDFQTKDTEERGSTPTSVWSLRNPHEHRFFSVFREKM